MFVWLASDTELSHLCVTSTSWTELGLFVQSEAWYIWQDQLRMQLS